MIKSSKKIMITIKNHICQISGSLQLIDEIREDPNFRMRVKNAWYAMQNARGWDGYKRFITPAGNFSTGLLPEIIDWFKDKQIAVEIWDKRNLFKEKGQQHELGGLTARDYQAQAVSLLLSNRVAGLRFQRGILYEATNAGKNLIAAITFDAFSKKRNGLFLINNQVIFNQAVQELTQLLGKDMVGYCAASKGATVWRKFNICMVQTLARRIKNDPIVRNNIGKTDIIIVDEADEVIGRKETRTILSIAWDAPVRVALTGSADTAKDKIKNKELIAFFGPILHRVSNKDLVDKGFSALPHITIHEGNTLIAQEDYRDEYEWGIIKSKERNRKIWKRVGSHLRKKRSNILILFQYHNHLKYLMKHIPPGFQEKYGIKIAGVHGKTKDREYILQKFKDGEIDVLFCSMIIKRGKNLPRMQVLINAAGGDSHTTIKQILGRALRKLAGVKEEVYLDDFFDTGNYLRRHSKHRVIYYKKEDFPVREKYKEKTK